MAEGATTGQSAELTAGANGGTALVRASQIAREAEVHRSANGVRFAIFGETGVPAPDLDRMLEAVPSAIAGALKTNTYFFVPLALREPDSLEANPRRSRSEGSDQAMVAPAWTEDLGEAAICHRNVELDQELGSGHRGIFISTRLMGDRFALSFEFFINVAHAFAEEAGVPERFAELAWRQVLNDVRGETSLDAWEARNLALGRPANWEPEPPPSVATARRGRTFGTTGSLGSRSFGAAAPFQLKASAEPAAADPKEREAYLESAFADALAIYLLSLALDVDYSELRERDYPLLAPGSMAERLRLMAELFPPNPGYEFAVRYRRRA